MERLTKRITENIIELSSEVNPLQYNGIPQRVHVKHPFWNVFDRLAEYEDLEEQVLKSTGTDLASMVGEFMHYYNLKKENRLLELPCKVGDEV